MNALYCCSVFYHKISKHLTTINSLCLSQLCKVVNTSMGTHYWNSSSWGLGKEGSCLTVRQFYPVASKMEKQGTRTYLVRTAEVLLDKMQLPEVSCDHQFCSCAQCCGDLNYSDLSAALDMYLSDYPMFPGLLAPRLSTSDSVHC